MDAENKIYHGMNYHAAKKLGIKYPYSENTVTYSTQSDKKATVKHEAIELAIFKALPHISYKKAHELTGDLETVIAALVAAGLI